MFLLIIDKRLNGVATQLPLNGKIKHVYSKAYNISNISRSQYNGLKLYKVESLAVTKVSFIVEVIYQNDF